MRKATSNKDAELVDKLRKVFKTTRTKEELSKATGIANPDTLERLVAINLRGELMTVFKLFPLVEVAWADGSIDQSEADTVIAAAIKMGVPKDGEAIGRFRLALQRPEGRRACGVVHVRRRSFARISAPPNWPPSETTF